MTAGDQPNGPLDIATLDVLARRAATDPLLDESTLQPDSMSPRRLELRLDVTQYPSAVEEARIDVRWFEGGDYTFHYLERRGSDRWQCRWDRHPKPDAPRTHFHPPPNATTVRESDIETTHHLGVLFAILEWVQTRVKSIHGPQE